MCAIDWSDGWEFYSAAERRARKDHKCYDCNRVIHRGETYHHAAGKSDGYFCDYKICAHCIAAGAWLNAACGGWLYGGIGEELREHWQYEPDHHSMALGRIIIGHRRRWRDGADPIPDEAQVRASVPKKARAA
jgi:hypothetical protein